MILTGAKLEEAIERIAIALFSSHYPEIAQSWVRMEKGLREYYSGLATVAIGAMPGQISDDPSL